MRPRDWFSVGARLFGIWVFYRGFVYLLYFIADCVTQLSRSELSREFEKSLWRSDYVVSGIALMGVGYLLVFHAERLTRAAFKESAETDVIDDQSEI
jgi:hypothetical protein